MNSVFAHLYAHSPGMVFAAKLPDFVRDSFVRNDYWSTAEDIWTNAVVVSKSESLRGWDLLESWVDLRRTKTMKEPNGKFIVNKRNEYGMLMGPHDAESETFSQSHSQMLHIVH